MWTYRSNDIRSRLMILAVHNMTSEAIQSLQNSFPNQLMKDSVRSFTNAKGITKDARSRSESANETKNRFERVRRLDSVKTAIQTSKFPKIAIAIKSDIKVPNITFCTISSFVDTSGVVSMISEL